MKILVTLAHPAPNSFNHALANTVCESLLACGHEVLFHDLYAEEFEPLLPAQEMPEDGIVSLDIQKHCEELQSAEGIVIIHPNWWGQPPAILKGWIDRVFRAGVAYQFLEGDSGEGTPIGLLKAQAALVLNTSNTPDERERVVFGDPLELLWKRCVFELCGVKRFYRRVFSVVVTSTLDQRGEWLAETRRLVREIFS